MEEIKFTQSLLDQFSKKFNNVADNLEKIERKMNELVRGYEAIRLELLTKSNKALKPISR